MLKPQYMGNSLVNLMSSIKQHFGNRIFYPPLEIFPIKEFVGINNICLLLIDGMGYNFLEKYGKKTTLYKHLRGKYTSVFPSTTAAAATTIYTGVAPLNHAVLGWFTYLRELGVISTILPLFTRGLKTPHINHDITAESIFQMNSFFSDLNAKGFVLIPKSLVNSSYNKVFSAGASQIGFNNLKELFQFSNNILKNSPGKKYLFDYWPELDEIGHIYGINSEKAINHFNEIDREFGNFCDQISQQVSSVKIIVTADHGLIDTTPQSTLILDQFPELYSMLTLPLCAEPRTVFCFVRPSKTEAFEKYITKHFADYCYMLRNQEFLDQKYLGCYEPHKKLFDRLGDYILLMKDNYILKDQLLGEKRKDLIGNHGGNSEDEMYIPLIIK